VTRFIAEQRQRDYGFPVEVFGVYGSDLAIESEAIAAA
jgi:hypothetical protein